MWPTANGESDIERERERASISLFSLAVVCGWICHKFKQIWGSSYFTSHSWVKLFKPQIFGGQRMVNGWPQKQCWYIFMPFPNPKRRNNYGTTGGCWSLTWILPLRTQKFFTRILEMSRNALLHRCDRGDTFCLWQLWVLSCSSMLPAPVGGGSNWGFWGSIDLGFTGNTPKNCNLHFNRKNWWSDGSVLVGWFKDCHVINVHPLKPM